MHLGTMRVEPGLLGAGVAAESSSSCLIRAPALEQGVEPIEPVSQASACADAQLGAKLGQREAGSMGGFE